MTALISGMKGIDGKAHTAAGGHTSAVQRAHKAPRELAYLISETIIIFGRPKSTRESQDNSGFFLEENKDDVRNKCKNTFRDCGNDHLVMTKWRKPVPRIS